MALLKYTPQFIEKQYIPTNLGVATELMGKMQGQYETGLDTQQKALSEAYGMKSTKGFEEGRNQFADRLKAKFDEAIARRGGDAGAALRDIQTEVINAKKDPFIRANEFALKDSDILEKQLANNPNLRILRDSRTSKYDPSLNDEDYRHQVFDINDVDKTIQSLYGNIAKRRIEGSPVFDPTSGYNVATTTLGATQGEINKLKSDPNVLSQIQSAIPQLGDLSSNPKLANEIQQRINSNIDQLSMGQQKQFIQPLRPVSSDKRLGTKGLNSGTGTLFMPELSIDKQSYKDAESNANLFGSMLGEDGNIDMEKAVDPNTQIIPESMTQMKAGLFDRGYAYKMLNKTKQIENKNYNKEQWNAYKGQYESLYDSMKGSGNTDADFIKKVSDIEKNKSVVAESRLVVDNKDFSKSLIEGKILPVKGGMFNEVNHGKKTNNTIGFEDFNAKFAKSGLDYTRSPVAISPQGELMMKSPDGMEYAINKNALPASVRGSLNQFGELYNDFFDYKMDKDKILRLNGSKDGKNIGKTYDFGSMKINLRVLEGDPSQKIAIIRYIDPETGQEEIAQSDDISNVYDNLASNIENIISKGR